MSPSLWGMVVFGFLAIAVAAAARGCESVGDDRSDALWDVAVICWVGFFLAGCLVAVGR